MKHFEIELTILDPEKDGYMFSISADKYGDFRRKYFKAPTSLRYGQALYNSFTGVDLSMGSTELDSDHRMVLDRLYNQKTADAQATVSAYFRLD